MAVLGVWAANQVSNTDRYVANITPLIGNPADPARAERQDHIRDHHAAERQAGLEPGGHPALTCNVPRLSGLLRNFSGPISCGIDGLVGTAVARAVASPAMARVWEQANRTAHAGLVKVLSGQGDGAVDVVNGQVTISLGPFIAQAKQPLANQGSPSRQAPVGQPHLRAVRGT